jgi:molybdopterin-containing oxidoreductase family membrane subunit
MSGDIFEKQFSNWLFAGELTWLYPILLCGNVLLPILFVFKKIRTNLYFLFFIPIFVNVGMWTERLWIVISATMHDFLPHNWGHYFPTRVEWAILAGSFSLFFFLFLAFSKLFPTIAISDVEKEQIGEEIGEENKKPEYKKPEKMHGVVGVYGNAESFLKGLKNLKEHSFGGIETFTPARLEQSELLLGRNTSGIRFLTLPGAIGGLAGGFALAILTALSFNLIIGGKHPISIIPYCIVAFEGTILIGSLANFAGILFFARLGPLKLHSAYDRNFSKNKFGLFAECDSQRKEAVEKIMTENGAEVVRGIGFD